MQTYSIGELSGKTEVKPETIRYFEKIGLLTVADRLPNGYRRYGKDHLRQLGFIQRCRKLGFSQAVIRDLVDVFEHAQNHTRAEVKSITTSHLEEIRGKIAELSELERSLSSLSEQCDGRDAPASQCPILAALSKEENL